MTLIPEIREELIAAARRRAIPRFSERVRWRWRAGLAGKLSVALPIAGTIAIGLIAIVALRPASTPRPDAAGAGAVELVYEAEPTRQTPVITQSAMERAERVMSARIAAIGLRTGVAIRPIGDRIVVDLPRTQKTARAERLLGNAARLAFYDWEANVLTPGGKTVASQLTLQDATAMTISQGGTTGAGDGAGAMNLYDAVRLASRQPPQVTPANGRRGPQYFIFGAPGSAACATAATDQGEALTPGVHCLVSGPANNQQDLRSGLPPGVSASQGQQLVVPAGTVVIQAADPNPSQQKSFTDPTAQFYVLKDHVSLSGNDIRDPQQSTDQSGSPNVTFSFTGRGQTAFQNVTAAVAHRGEQVSGFGQQLNQHFAVAFDDKLITVPQIDSRTYPDGITGGGGADITGGFTVQSAQDLRILLELGQLPVDLKLLSERQIAARH